MGRVGVIKESFQKYLEIGDWAKTKIVHRVSPALLPLPTINKVLIVHLINLNSSV